VPCAAGTPPDLVARILAKGMSEISGQYAYVENITVGAGPIDMDTAEKLLEGDHSILFNLGYCDDESGRPQNTMSMK
jgi:tripartite-type tricarboxylate transporter receptor subunit TctC